MKKLLIFHPALAPYRIDQFNALSKLFDLEVVFIFDNVWNHKFNQDALLSQVMFKVSFLLTGIRFKERVFRFGMLKTIKRINPDIILGYEYSLTTQYLIFLRKFGVIKQKIGATIDDSIDICYNVQSRVRYFARNQSVKRLDYLVVMSSEVSEYYQKTFNLKPYQIIISPILQNPERLRKDTETLETLANRYWQEYDLKGKKVLLFVGRFVSEKGLSGFIKSIRPALLEKSEFVLVLVGDGINRQSIQLYIKENHLEAKVLMPGRYEGHELYAWYLCASGFVLPSIYEPFGAVVNEALIFGLKVLCTKYAGASCLVNESNGLIFNPLDEEDTLNKLYLFLDSVNLTEEICLTLKPSLMPDHQQNFINEWRKLI